MATVGNLFINVKARTGSFNKKMTGVRATVSKLGRKLLKVAKKAALFGAAMGALAFGALVVMTKKGLAAVDMLAKTASKLGIATDALIGLQMAATTSGVSVETFNMAMQRMVRRVAEAAMGTGEAVKALQELGLDAKSLARLPVDEQFMRVADAMAKVTNQGDKVRLAMKLFDSEGVALVNTLKGGSAALREMQQEAKDLGLVMDDDQIKLVEEAVTAWDKIGFVWRNLGQQLAVHFAPILIEIANRIKNMVIEFGGMSQVAEFIVRAFFMAGAGIMDMIKMITVGWLGLKAAVIQASGDIAVALASVFGGDLEWIGKALQDEAAAIAGVINDKLAEGWDTSQVDEYIRNLREKWKKGMPAAMTGAFPDFAAADDVTGGSKQNTIQTVLGSFKLGGDVGQIVQSQQLDELNNIGGLEEDSLRVSKDILSTLKRGSGALT